MDIQVLHKQGHSIRSIAKELGLSRNSVRKYLRESVSAPHYSTRPAKPSKLEPYLEYINARIKAAHPDWIAASVMYRELLERGYTGKIRILSSYLQTLRPIRPSEPVVRFETAPAEQMQVDFTIIRRSTSPLKAFVATLGYSRASFVKFYDNERSESWLDGLREAFHYFGGVPRRVLFDNAKAIILERDYYSQGEHRWHPGLLVLCNQYGFKAQVCRPYRAKTKGKVERFNRYLKESFVTPLKATYQAQGLMLDVMAANAYIGPWLHDIANARVHATTGVSPYIRLEQEKYHFIPLPNRETEIIVPSTASTVPIPFESIQHALSQYDAYIPRSYA